MKLDSYLIQDLSRRCGCDITTPAGATILANEIESKLGERLSANTIKRLVGVLPYKGTPRETTLDIIARYIGFTSWRNYLSNCESAFGSYNPIIEVRNLYTGAEISFGWFPDKSIKLKHLGEGRCEVIEVTNSKLNVGDVMVLSQLLKGYRFVAKDVIRNGQSLGIYTASPDSGISHIVIE